MTEGNGGDIKVGERLRRIEDRLETIETHLEARIERHKKANEQTVKELATSVIRDFGDRISKLETEAIAEQAAHDALEAAKREAQSNKRWVIGIGFTLGMLLLAALSLLFQLLGEVGA